MAPHVPTDASCERALTFFRIQEALHPGKPLLSSHVHGELTAAKILAAIEGRVAPLWRHLVEVAVFGLDAAGTTLTPAEAAEAADRLGAYLDAHEGAAARPRAPGCTRTLGELLANLVALGPGWQDDALLPAVDRAPGDAEAWVMVGGP